MGHARRAARSSTPRVALARCASIVAGAGVSSDSSQRSSGGRTTWRSFRLLRAAATAQPTHHAGRLLPGEPRAGLAARPRMSSDAAETPVLLPSRRVVGNVRPSGMRGKELRVRQRRTRRSSEAPQRTPTRPRSARRLRSNGRIRSYACATSAYLSWRRYHSASAPRVPLTMTQPRGVARLARVRRRAPGVARPLLTAWMVWMAKVAMWSRHTSSKWSAHQRCRRFL